MLSGRGLCDELITRPEESYRLCCVVVCDLETSRMGAPYIYDIRRLRVKSHFVGPAFMFEGKLWAVTRRDSPPEVIPLVHLDRGHALSY